MARRRITRMLVVGAAVVGLTGGTTAIAFGGAGMPAGDGVSIQARHGDDDFRFDDHGHFDDNGGRCFGFGCFGFDDDRGHHGGGHH